MSFMPQCIFQGGFRFFFCPLCHKGIFRMVSTPTESPNLVFCSEAGRWEVCSSNTVSVYVTYVCNTLPKGLASIICQSHWKSDSIAAWNTVEGIGSRVFIVSSLNCLESVYGSPTDPARCKFTVLFGIALAKSVQWNLQRVWQNTELDWPESAHWKLGISIRIGCRVCSDSLHCILY